MTCVHSQPQDQFFFLQRHHLTYHIGYTTRIHQHKMAPLRRRGRWDGGQVKGHVTTPRDPASWWKQSEERPAVDSIGKQQIHLHLTQHKYLYVDLYSHHSYTHWHICAISFSVFRQRLWHTTSKAFTFLSSEQLSVLDAAQTQICSLCSWLNLGTQ